MRNHSNKKNYNNIKMLNDLPFKIGAASLSVIFCVGEGIFNTLGGILEGPSQLTIGRASRGCVNSGSFLGYYDEIKSLRENSLKTALWRLQEKGLIEKKDNTFKLTLLGEKYFKYLKKVEKVNNLKWDGKWRIVMFDIPEKLKKDREWVRRQLYGLEYKAFQKSVFIGKFPIPQDLFKKFFKKSLMKYINIMTVGEIDNEDILNKF